MVIISDAQQRVFPHADYTQIHTQKKHVMVDIDIIIDNFTFFISITSSYNL